MRQFKDKTGREWSLELTIGTVERLRKSSDFDLYEPGQPITARPLAGHPGETQPSLEERLSTDWSLFWEVLFLVLEPELQDAGIDAAQFGRLMNAAALVEAHAAFWQEWTDFFRGLRNEAYATALDTQRTFQEAQRRVMEAKAKDPRIATMMQTLEAEAARLTEATLSDALRIAEESLSGKKPASPA